MIKEIFDSKNDNTPMAKGVQKCNKSANTIKIFNEINQIENFILNIYAGSNSGKSVLTMCLLNYLTGKNKYHSVIISNNGIDTDKYKLSLKGHKGDTIFKDITTQNMTELIEYQDKTKNKDKFLIVFEDIYGSDLRKEEYLKIVNKFRHFNITIIHIAHSASSIHPLIRNEGMSIVFNTLNQEQLKAIYSSINLNISKKEFFELVNSLVRYEGLFINIYTREYSKIMV